MPDILNTNSTQTEEAAQEMAKLFDGTMDPNEEDKESILEPFKFLFYDIEDMWLFCEEIMDKRGSTWHNVSAKGLNYKKKTN